MSEHHEDNLVSMDGRPDPRARFRTLPAPIHVQDTTEGQDPLPPPDLDNGRDPNQEFVRRFPIGG